MARHLNILEVINRVLVFIPMHPELFLFFPTLAGNTRNKIKPKQQLLPGNVPLLRFEYYLPGKINKIKS